MAPSTERDRATAAAAILSNMKGDDEDERKQEKKRTEAKRARKEEDERKQERKKKREQAMNASVGKIKAKKAEERRQFFASPEERVQLEGPLALLKPCEAAIRRCIKEGVEVPEFLKRNPLAEMPDPLLSARPLVAPVEDDSLLMVWPDDSKPDPERANDTTDVWFFDNVKVIKPQPGEEQQLGWYCASRQKQARRLPDAAIRNKKPKKRAVVMTINIKQPHDEKPLDD